MTEGNHDFTEKVVFKSLLMHLDMGVRKKSMTYEE